MSMMKAKRQGCNALIGQWDIRECRSLGMLGNELPVVGKGPNWHGHGISRALQGTHCGLDLWPIKNRGIFRIFCTLRIFHLIVCVLLAGPGVWRITSTQEQRSIKVWMLVFGPVYSTSSFSTLFLVQYWESRRGRRGRKNVSPSKFLLCPECCLKD